MLATSSKIKHISLNYMASYDVASTVHPSMLGGHGGIAHSCAWQGAAQSDKI